MHALKLAWNGSYPAYLAVVIEFFDRPKTSAWQQAEVVFFTWAQIEQIPRLDRQLLQVIQVIQIVQ